MKQSIYILFIGILIGILFLSKPFILLILSSILIFAISALGLNIISGYTGQISIGHGAFMAIGAFTTAYLTLTYNIPFFINLIIAMLLSAILGIIIGLPALRLRGFYLAIATMAFGIAVEQLIGAFDFLGGHVGLRDIPPLIKNDFGIYIINLIFYVLLSYFAIVLTKSPIGLKYKMIRESEIASRAYGINISYIKLHAFIISAIYGGIAGTLYAHTMGYISPTDFGLATSLNLLAMIIIGGISSIHGGLIGAIVITGLPFIFSRSNIPMSLIFGGLLIIFVLFFPKGIMYGLIISYFKYFEIPYVAFKKKLWRDKKMNGKYVKINGKNIYYYENGNGKTVIMIHGNFASARWFQKVMNIEGFKIFALDLPNFGRSDRIEKCDIDLYADYVKMFMDKLKIEKAIIVGHSLGGAVAQSLSFRYPEKSEKLLLIDSSPINGLKTPEENYPVLEMYKGNKTLLKTALKSIMPENKDEKLLDELTNDALLMNENCFAGNARALEKYDYTDIAKNYKNKVLFILGKKDLLITEAMAKETLKYLNGELKMFDHIGHSIIVEDPELFINELRNF
ncbi:amino acid/amide ABC transporter membrane protein 2, HAAT family [Marinitoga hydrogenitolerans DSM 16785]|uniref:Amino acid/amide ABC transporter membrane protein 2, HAAT family n=1 Tax=Marinitoga hydrogenitolerans (strain DSM 16785 / JCM 12826 / AT1271) TaxID=1122195 RepID=A0A1M4XAU0_MARH1|nr:alpha/beta fold hydrolase [Marinitoga hydrogenitolerans]SHE90530.1 amino acid/amide ABC transporter membrane protein 2, HAAT family [Marinitoga hydrogenitolerans DSM 16785]